jgi:heme-degrading monooxygenase HmoA
MYVAIRRLKVQPGLFDEAVQRVENALVPFLSSMPGFVEFVGVQVGEDEGLTISFFETQEQAEEANKRSLAWAAQNLAPLAAGPPEIVAVGVVLLRKAKDSE